MSADAFSQPFRETRLQCPNCAVPLIEIERAHVMIDACQHCRGVWLDRGELDRLLERERQTLTGSGNQDRDFIREMQGHGRGEAPASQSPVGSDRSRSGRRSRNDWDDDSDDYRHRGPRQKKRRGFDLLEDLFDF